LRVVKLPDRFSTLKDRFEAIVFREMAENHVNDHDRLLEMMSPRFREIIAQGRTTKAIIYQETLNNVAYFHSCKRRAFEFDIPMNTEESQQRSLSQKGFLMPVVAANSWRSPRPPSPLRVLQPRPHPRNLHDRQ